MEQGHQWRRVEPDIFKEICGGEKGLGTTIVSYVVDASRYPVRGQYLAELLYLSGSVPL